MVTLYVIDQYGMPRGWATGNTESSARALIEQTILEYRQNRPDLRLRVVTQ